MMMKPIRGFHVRNGHHTPFDKTDTGLTELFYCIIVNDNAYTGNIEETTT